jgi:hypothetical protein
MAKSSWEIDDDTEAIERALEHEFDSAVVRVGKKILAQAAKKAPKDTGGLSKSGAIKGEGTDTESDAKAAAIEANPELDYQPFERITSTPGISSVEIGFGADYAAPVHNGHMAGNTFVAPRPFLTNAINANEETLETEGNKGMERAFAKARK